MALALIVCLATILWCILLTRRQTNRLDRVLTGLLGMIAIYEALRVLRDTGLVSFKPSTTLNGWVDFLIAILCMIAALILKISSMDRASTKVRLRLVEANEKPVEFARSASAVPQELAYVLFDASPLATLAVDSNEAVIYWNAAAEELLGWSREEILGQRLPFTPATEILNKRGRIVDAVVWAAPVVSTNGASRATLVIIASSSALREAGFSDTRMVSKAKLAINS